LQVTFLGSLSATALPQSIEFLVLHGINLAWLSKKVHLDFSWLKRCLRKQKRELLYERNLVLHDRDARAMMD
jgi:hypothetical protein